MYCVAGTRVNGMILANLAKSWDLFNIFNSYMWASSSSSVFDFYFYFYFELFLSTPSIENLCLVTLSVVIRWRRKEYSILIRLLPSLLVYLCLSDMVLPVPEVFLNSCILLLSLVSAFLIYFLQNIFSEQYKLKINKKIFKLSEKF